MAAKQSTNDQKDQIERFKEAARALECDEAEAAFDEKLKEIARQKPKPLPGQAQKTNGKGQRS